MEPMRIGSCSYIPAQKSRTKCFLKIFAYGYFLILLCSWAVYSHPRPCGLVVTRKTGSKLGVRTMHLPNSTLSQWTPASAILPNPQGSHRALTRVAVAEGSDFLEQAIQSTVQDLWTIRVRYAECAEIFVAGDFNRWRLPGERLMQWGYDLWEASVALEPGAYRFACYVLGRRGFRRISSDCVEYFIENKVITRRTANAH